MIDRNLTKGSFSLDEMEAVLSRARDERAKAMRKMLGALPGLFKRLVAHKGPAAQHVPQHGALARG